MWTICDGRSCPVFSVQQDLCQDRKIMSQQISAQVLQNTHWDGLEYRVLFCVGGFKARTTSSDTLIVNVTFKGSDWAKVLGRVYLNKA